MVSPSGTAPLRVSTEVGDAVAGVASPRPAASVPLATLAVGRGGVVLRLALDRPVARRLMELGLLPGTRVEVVRVAPLGDPIELAIRGYRLSIRRAEAARIEVVAASREAR